MSIQRYKVKEVLTGFTRIKDAIVTVEKGKIRSVESFNEEVEMNNNIDTQYEEKVIIPGFIDNHNHGGYGIDFSEANLENIKTLMSYFPKEGITTMLPTVGAMKKEKVSQFIELINEYVKDKENGVTDIVGIHLEGPFLSPEKSGLLDPDAMLGPNSDLVEDWIESSNGLLKVMTIAPELPGAIEVIKLLKEYSIVASVGHSNATMEEMNKAVEAGSNQITHLFNGMRTLHHREPGILGVGLTNKNVFAEMVGFDTHSIHPSMWKMAYELKGSNRMILSTDANTVKGLPEGKYTIKGREIEYKNGRIYTPYQGSDMHPGVPMTFIGTVTNTMKYTGATLEDIVVMSSVNPAKQVRIFDKKGSLTAGKDADFIVLDDNYDIEATYCNGICAYSAS